MRGRVLALALALILSASTATAAPNPKARASCSKAGLSKTFKGKKFTCVKSGKKLVWNKGEKTGFGSFEPGSSYSAPTPSASPTPNVTPTQTAVPSATETASPTATVQPTLSISERWLKIDSAALKVFNEWATKEIPKSHSVRIEFVLSDKANQQAVEEIKRRYDLAARFWAPYSSVTNDFKVLIANHNEVKWICELKLNWLQVKQPDCEEVESNGRSNIPTAGQVQVGKRNVDMYQVKDRAELDTLFFMGRVEHEFTHNIFYEQSNQYQNFMPCWQIEGGAEFFGIMIATRLDPNTYIQARNIKFETDFLRLNEFSWSLEDWIKFLNEIDRSDIANRQGDTCGPVRPKIYAHSVLANEYLVQRVGIPGYLKLIRDSGNTSWAATIRNTFKVDKQEFYREMAIYMMAQYRLARENRWSYSELWNVPFGR